MIGTIGIATGIVLYEVNDIRFSMKGTILVILNLIAAVGERVAQYQLLAVRKVDISRPSLIILNNGIGAFLVIFAMLVFSPREALHLVDAVSKSSDTAFWVSFSSLVGVFLAYFGIWLQVQHNLL